MQTQLANHCLLLRGASCLPQSNVFPRAGGRNIPLSPHTLRCCGNTLGGGFFKLPKLSIDNN
jgi:hypothetical protein